MILLSPPEMSNIELFDPRHLHCIRAPGCENSRRRLYPECVRERITLCKLGRKSSHHEFSPIYVKPQFKPLWPVVPQMMPSSIPPFRIRSVVPITVRAYGLYVAANHLTRSLKNSNPAAWVLWGATLTLFLQEVVTIFAEELDPERLHWLPNSPIAQMRQLGLDAFVGGITGCGRALDHALDNIHRVNWTVVDPAGSTALSTNQFRYPIFTSGEYVLWKITGVNS